MTGWRIAAAVLLALLLPAAARAEELLIIANPSVAVDGPLSDEQIAAIYLLKTTLWPDGRHIVPVNREASSEIRARFTGAVLKEDRASLAAYWNEMHFKGQRPPVVQESEQAMLAFVQNVPGAIGYVSASLAPGNVKVLAHVP